jgi:hypothetical protein
MIGCQPQGGISGLASASYITDHKLLLLPKENPQNGVSSNLKHE